MKSILNLGNSLLIGTLALGTLGLFAPNITQAEGKGASKLMFAAPASPSVSTSKMASMSCTRCTDGYTRVANTSPKGLLTSSTKKVAVHMCSSCQTTIQAVGAGKAKTDKVSHTCGSNSPAASSCCVAAK